MSGPTQRSDENAEAENSPVLSDRDTVVNRSRLARFDPGGTFGTPLLLVGLAVTLMFLILPVVLTVVASFATDWTGILPSGFYTVENWTKALTGDVGSQRGLGDGLWFSALLATGGMVINILIGVPVAYVVTRYEFPGRDWINAFSILPIAPGIILGVAFLQTYPQYAGSVFGLIVGYSILKSPFMVLIVQSSFQSMDLRQLEETGRSLGASWLRTFVTIIVPNAKKGILAGAIVTWILAAAEFNFTWLVYARGPEPFALFLYSAITRNPILIAAAGVSVYFLIVMLAVMIIQLIGGTGFSTIRNAELRDN